VLRRQRFGLIHAHWLVPQGLVAVVARRMAGVALPLVTTSHGADLFALRGRAFDAMRRLVVNESAQVSVVSTAMRDRLIGGGAEADKIQVIPMGADLQARFTLDARVVRNKHELLFVGRLVEKKGVRVLIEALPDVLRAHPAARVTLVGDGPLAPELRALAARLGVSGHCRFLGMIPQAQLPDLYRRATLLAAPFVVAASGDQEGLGLVQAEAAGCGCPVIAGDVPAVHDAIVHGESGLLVPPGDAQALAAAIRRLLDDHKLRERLARNARQHCMAAFDWESVAARYGDLLTEAMRSAQR